MQRTKWIECCASRIAIEIMEVVSHCFREDEHHDLYAEIYDRILDGLSSYASESSEIGKSSKANLN